MNIRSNHVIRMFNSIEYLFGRAGMGVDVLSEEFIVDTMKWRERKRAFWDRLWEDLEIGYLDEDLLPLLILLNLDANIYTMSSCSGRIVLSDSSFPWSREETSIVFKRHEPIKPIDIESILEKPVTRRLWLNVTGPIIHLSTNSLNYALEILRHARSAGYKHSGILSMSPEKGVVIELTTGIWFSQLLRTREAVITPRESLDELVGVANTILLKGKELLRRLFNTIHNRSYTVDEEIQEDLGKRGVDLDMLFRKYIDKP